MNLVNQANKDIREKRVNRENLENWVLKALRDHKAQEDLVAWKDKRVIGELVEGSANLVALVLLAQLET